MKKYTKQGIYNAISHHLATSFQSIKPLNSDGKLQTSACAEPTPPQTISRTQNTIALDSYFLGYRALL